MMRCCTTDSYDRLYARWLARPGTLLDLAGWMPGRTLLDLCGGTGAVSREALRRGALPGEITLADLNPRAPDLRIAQIECDLNQTSPGGQYDVVVIRQAIAYLDWRPESGLTARLRALLAPGGVLVFNTFQRPRWALHSYRFEGRKYLEASMYLGRRVWHLQSDFREFDITAFRWWKEPEIHRALEAGGLLATMVSLSETSQYWTVRAP